MWHGRSLKPCRPKLQPLSASGAIFRQEGAGFTKGQTRYSIAIHYLKGTRGQKTPDFLIQHEGKDIALEIGGKGKGRRQFKGITTDRKLVLAPDIAPQPDRLPLHLVGFLEG